MIHLLRKTLPVLLLSVFSFPAFSQANYTISGYLKDAKDGESLIGATVIVEGTGNGAVSNTYGYYSITLAEGNYTLIVSYIGYQTQRKEVSLTSNQKLDFEMGLEGQELEEVVITSEALDENVNRIGMSVEKMDSRIIKKIPAFLGEADVVNSIKTLPGVSTVGEGASGFNVRGGGVGQNLVLLDEAVVYNSSHMLGFFSVFNPDAVKDLKLYKGGIPARYGGRISSILDIQMKEGNSKKLGVQGGVGTIFSRIAVEAPIVKDKSSFILAARRSYIDVLARPFVDVLSEGGALNFYDITGKVNYKFSDRDRIYLSGYIGRDNFKFDANQGFSWGNATATFRWNHLMSDRLFMNLSGIYADYDYELEFGEDESDKFQWKSRIRTLTVKPDFSWYLNSNNEISFGGELIRYDFNPADATTVSQNQETNISLDERFSYEGALYIGNKQKFGNRFSAEYGLRWSTFYYVGPGSVYEYGYAEPGKRRPVVGITEAESGEVVSSYNYFEPRIALRYRLSETSSVKASYNRMAQYIHLISNRTASIPLDVWQPSTNNITPQVGDQIALGYFQNFRNNEYEFSVEAYYKETQNQIEYIDGADLLINEFLEGDLLSGQGRAYGLEFLVRKVKGKLTGWASYTLAKTELKTEGINNFEWYPTRFDQRHNFKVTAIYTFNERWSLSSNFAFISGTPSTWPTDRYEVQGYLIPHNGNNTRNNLRIPAYHRLDVSVTLNGKKEKKGRPRKNQDYWVFGLYNVYGRQNPFSIYFTQGTDRPAAGTPIDSKGVQVAIIGSIVPAFSYNFKF